MSTQLPEYLENPNTKVKSVTREHSKTSYKLSKTRGHAKKVQKVGGSNKSSKNYLYSQTTKPENIFDETNTVKKAKIAKQTHTCKGSVSLYNVEILNSFNSKLQLKDTESATRNKLND